MTLDPSLILGCLILIAWGYIYRSKPTHSIPPLLNSPFIKLGLFVVGITVLIVGIL